MLGLIILAIVVYYIFNSSHQVGSCWNHPSHTNTSMDILDERYARGEINREEYLERKQELTGQKRPVSLKKNNE